MPTRIAILDDYNRIGLSIGDWASLRDCEITVFEDHLYDTASLIERLKPFDVVCAMRERTAFPRELFENLPKLKLLNVTAGLHSRVFDFNAAQDHGVVCCRTDPDLPYPDGTKRPGTMMEITFGLIIACTRQLVHSDRAMRRGGWESPLCNRLADLTLGLVGLGSIGIRVAKVAKAFSMRTIAWSENLTAERAAEHDVQRVDREELFRSADVVSLQMRLSDRTEGMITKRDFDLMKPSAYFINTSRGGLVNEPDLIEALRTRRIAGAGLDVFAVEPLPPDSPLRSLENTVLTAHLGYSTPPQFQVYYEQFVENIRAWQAGRPIRKLKERAPGEHRERGFWVDEGMDIEQQR